MSKEKHNDNDYITERLCVARTLTLEEKISSLKKQIYIAAAVNALWITILQLVLSLR